MYRPFSQAPIQNCYIDEIFIIGNNFTTFGVANQATKITPSIDDDKIMVPMYFAAILRRTFSNVFHWMDSFVDT